MALWLAAAIVGPAAPNGAVLDKPSRRYQLSCENGATLPPATLDHAPLFDTDLALALEATRAALVPGYAPVFGEHLRADMWLFVERSAHAVVLANLRSAERIVRMQFTANGPRLKYASHAYCSVSANAYGRTMADWWLDPGARIDGNTTRFVAHLEGQCWSGGSMIGRIDPPHFVYAKTAVIVTITLEPRRPAGVYWCQDSSPILLVITLGEPLGRRELQDGRTFPPESARFIPYGNR